MNYEEVTNKIAKLKETLVAKNEEVINKATAEDVTLEEVKALENEVQELHGKIESLNRAAENLKREAQPNKTKNEVKEKMTVKVSDVLNKIGGRELGMKDFLNAMKVEDDNSKGTDLIPDTMDNALVIEPDENNPLHGLISRSQNTTTLPMLDVEIAGEDIEDVLDGESAQEIKARGGQITFAHTQTRLMTKFTENLEAMTNVKFEAELKRKLASGIAKREVHEFFTTAPKSGKEHKSVYGAGIKEIAGADLFDTIVEATEELKWHGDLTLMLTRKDYVALAKSFNGEVFTALENLEKALGVKEIKVTPYAVKPIVGNFKFYRADTKADFSRIRSEIDIETGVVKCVLSQWQDAQFVLKSAFRVLNVTPK